MPNCESNRNGWKDGKSKWDYCDKKEDPYCCESKDSHCENDKHEHDCHKKDCKDKEHECNHHDKKKECCCKESMKKALELLSCPRISPFVNFDEFAFIGHNFLVGTSLDPASPAFTIDNITPPSGQFKGLDFCDCDLIKLGTNSNVFYPIPGSVQLDSFTVNHASLCDIEAIAFNYTAATAAAKAAFEAILTELLDEACKKCDVKCDECCCNDGIFNAIFSKFIPSNQVDLTAGSLAVANAKVLGRVENVLVLSSANTNRIYFVCLDSIGFINS